MSQRRWFAAGEDCLLGASRIDACERIKLSTHVDKIRPHSEKGTPALLEMKGVSKRFGATEALSNVDLLVEAGSVHALIGENGAGKSTLMKILSGALSPDEGKIFLDGTPFQGQNPANARQEGVAMIYQELTLAPDLNVVDNICLGREFNRLGVVSKVQQRKIVKEVLGQLGCGHLNLACPVGEFSVAEQQLIEIARALAYDARMIVFDEPTSSLTQQDAQNLFDIIDGLKSRNIGIVYISHFLEEIRRVADCYTVLRDGKRVGGGQLEGITEKEIIHLMVGRHVEQLFPKHDHPIGEGVLDLKSISGDTIPRQVSFELRKGEVLGFAGLVGAGRTELLRVIYGLDPIASGRLKIADSWRSSTSPQRSIRSGLAMVSEDRKMEGLAQEQSIGENITYSRIGAYSRFGFLNLSKRREAVDSWIRKIEIKTLSQDDPIDSLSGGNQQKVAIARVLHQEADIYLLDEPTRGIDVGTKSEIYRIIDQLAAAGKSIIVVSSYLPELMQVCDRIAVMSRGLLRDVRDVEQWTQNEVMVQAVSTEQRFK